MDAGIPYVACYIDDIIMSGTTIEEHRRNLQEVLLRLKVKGISVKREKCEFFSKSMQYLGYIISEVRLATVPSKTEATVKAPLPKNVQELRSFLGLINYYRKFIPNLSTILSPLHVLLKKSCPWVWT